MPPMDAMSGARVGCLDRLKHMDLIIAGAGYLRRGRRVIASSRLWFKDKMCRAHRRPKSIWILGGPAAAVRKRGALIGCPGFPHR